MNPKKKYSIQSKTRKSDHQYIPQDYKNVARDWESQFARLMIEKMKATIPSETKKSTATEIYESYLIDEQAKAMAQKNRGKGIQELILNQIYPKRFRNNFAYQGYMQNKKNLMNRYKTEMEIGGEFR